nr:mediator of RNA polymerase II transcription subunit 1-like [Ipomoea batatas]
MERSEPTLVPEWLRSTGTVTGGGNSGHHFTTSFRSELSPSARNRSSRTINNKDSPHAPFLERSSSSNSRRSLSSNSSKHPYSSFTRSHRDRNHDKEKERSFVGDLWNPSSSDPFGSIITGRVEKISLRRSQSLVTRKPGDLLPRRTEDSKNGMNIIQSSGNGVLLGGSNLDGVHKASFERDFPSLGADDKPASRVSSPGLGSAVQSLPIGNSALLGSEKWTSALAEVPAIIGSNGMGNSSTQQTVSGTPTLGVSGASTCLNMAEALSQVPARARVTPQVPDKTQRLEELAVKQSRQLIPVTPSMPKALVFSSSDKMKQPKLAVRTSEMGVAAKTIQQQPFSSQLTNQPRVGRVRSDAPNTSHVGKFLVLKPVATSATKDAPSLANVAGGRVAHEPPPVSPLSPLTSSSTPKVSAPEIKAGAPALNLRPSTEKKLPLSQAQSRSDFFNLMRKKTSPKTTTLPDSSAAFSSFNSEESDTSKGDGRAPVSPVVEDGQITSNGPSHGTCDNAQRCSDGVDPCLDGMIYPDEEEAAFLRSLGWDENAVEDEGLTEEEINGFYQEYMKVKPSLNNYRGAQPKNISSEFSGKSGAAATDSSSSELEA